MQYLALYIVLLTFILLSFVRGKHVLFNIIIMAYPTMVIYKAIIDYMNPGFIANLEIGLSLFTKSLILFILILIPVYISMFRITHELKLHEGVKGIIESILLSIGIVLLTIGICFHILPDKDVFNLARTFELFFQSDAGYMLCMIIPMFSVFFLSKRSLQNLDF